MGAGASGQVASASEADLTEQWRLHQVQGQNLQAEMAMIGLDPNPQPLGLEAMPAADIRFFTPKASSGWHLFGRAADSREQVDGDRKHAAQSRGGREGRLQQKRR